MDLKKKVHIFLGTGGVGKTTLSAIYALQQAHQNPELKIKLVTIDPSKRLKDFFGIANQNSTQRGNLTVSLGDRKELFQEFLETASKKKNIPLESFENNRLFKSLMQGLSVSQEFTSLYEIKKSVQDQKHDLVIVDTPPLQNSSEFLSSAKLLKLFFSSSLVDFFISEDDRGVLFKIINRARRIGLDILGRLTGAKFVEEVAQFFKVTESIKPEILKVLEESEKIIKTQSYARVVCKYNELSLKGLRLALKNFKADDFSIQKVLVNSYEENSPFNKIIEEIKQSNPQIELQHILKFQSPPANQKDLERVMNQCQI